MFASIACLALAACLFASCGASSWQRPLPTVPGPERAELLAQVRGTLVWIDGPGSRTLHVRAFPSGAERTLELAFAPHDLDGPNVNGWLVLACERELRAQRLDDPNTAIVVARADEDETFGSPSLCAAMDVVHFLSRRSVRIPGRERKGAETQLVAVDLRTLRRSSIRAPVSLYPRSIASAPAGGVACFQDGSAGERDVLVVRSSVVDPGVTPGVRGVSLRSSPSGHRHLVETEPNVWALFDVAWRHEPARDRVVARPVDFASDECLFACALPTAGHEQRYHRWFVMNGHVASWPLQLIRLADEAHVTVLHEEPWLCSFGPFDRW